MSTIAIRIRGRERTAAAFFIVKGAELNKNFNGVDMNSQYIRNLKTDDGKHKHQNGTGKNMGGNKGKGDF